MKAKDYLEQVARAEKELRVLRAKVAHYEDLGLTITTSTTNTPIRASKGSSRVESAAVGIVDTLGEIEAKIADFVALIAMCENRIKKIPQERYQRLLTLHYICGWKLPKVGEELGYSDRNSIYRAHGWALLEMGKVLKGEEKT